MKATTNLAHLAVLVVRCPLLVLPVNMGLAAEGRGGQGWQQVRARVEYTFACMSWKVIRACCLKGEGVSYAVLGMARLYNLTLAG